MKAQLLIYTGQKNPTWSLDDDTSQKIYKQLRILPGTLLLYENESFLGYRGIEVVLDANEKLRVFKGLAEVSSGNESRRFMDYNRELEAWIFNTAKGCIDDAVFNQLVITEF